MKVSIITVVFNNSKKIPDTISSVLEQDYKPIEYIVIDGGSTDGTVNVIKKNEKYITKWVSEPDNGIYDAMNKGLSLATGNVVGILNSDDRYRDKTIISKVVSKFMNDESLDSLYGNLVYIDGNSGKIIRHWNSNLYFRKNFLFGWMPPHPAFFVRKRVFEKYGYFNTTLKSAADYELMLRFLYKNKIKTTYIPEVLTEMTTGGVSNKSLKNRIIANKEDRLAWRINNLKPYFFTLYLKPLRKIFQYF